MSKIFWVTCPNCQEKFYCDYVEMRHKKHLLLCPYCNLNFPQEKSPQIVE